MYEIEELARFSISNLTSYYAIWAYPICLIPWLNKSFTYLTMKLKIEKSFMVEYIVIQS